MTEGFKCDGCGEFTESPIKVNYPVKDKMLDYLGVEVEEDDLQDEQQKVEHYCEDCGEKINSIGDK